MWKYIIRRILMLIPVLVAVSFVICALLELAPGDPASMILGADTYEYVKDEWREAHNLNDPFLVQYAEYMWGIITRFDFGESFRSNIPVTATLIQRFPTTFLLAVLTTAVSTVVGVVMGIAAAKRRNTWADSSVRVFAMLGTSIPAFVIALLLIIAFAVKLRWLPVSGFYSWKHLVLPIVTVGFGTCAGIMRFARSSFLDCMEQDYVRTARAKGQNENYITRHHILRNSLIPIITMAGSLFGTALGGQIIIEQVFAIPGLGKLMIDSINTRDYPLVKSSVILLALCIGVVNLLVDIAYAYVDPRIKSRFEGKKKKKIGKKTGEEAAV